MDGLDPNSLDDRQLLLLIYEKVDGQGKRLDSQGKRITSLEQWRTFIVGGATAIGLAWQAMKVIGEKHG